MPHHFCFLHRTGNLAPLCSDYALLQQFAQTVFRRRLRTLSLTLWVAAITQRHLRCGIAPRSAPCIVTCARVYQRCF